MSFSGFASNYANYNVPKKQDKELKNINDLDIIRGEKNTLKKKGYDKNDEATIHTRIQSKNSA